MKNRLYFTLINVLLLMISSANAGTKTWKGSVSTDWANSANWNPAGVPTSADDVVIPANPTAIIMPLVTTGTFTTNTITIAAGATLTQTGGTLFQDGGKGDINYISGTYNISGGTYLTNNATTINSGGIVNISGTAVIHVSNSLVTSPTEKFNILAGANLTQSGGVVKIKDLTINNGIPAGTYTKTGGTFVSYHDFKNSGAFISSGGTDEFAASAGGAAFPNNTAISQFNDILIDAGVDPGFDNNGAVTIKVNGNWTNNGGVGTLTKKATIVEFNGTGNQTIGGSTVTSFRNLVINKAGGIAVLAASQMVSNGNLSINSGTFNLSTFTCNGATATENLTLAGGATLALGGSTGGQTGSNFPLNFNTVTIDPASTVEYNGGNSITQTVYATPIYGSLTLSNSTGSGSASKISTANLTVNGNLTVNSNVVFSPAAANIVSGLGTLTGSGTIQVTRTAATADFLSQYPIAFKTLTNLTVDYNAALAQTVNTLNYGNLTISGARTANNITFQSGAAIGIAGVFRPNAVFTAGQCVVKGTNINFNGLAAQNIPSFDFDTLSISGSGTKTVTGPVNIVASLKIRAGNLAAAGLVTLKSTATQTATVAQITSTDINPITGNVTVERYVQGKRTYRFLTAPVNSSTSIRANWMENVNNPTPAVNLNPVAGYGTHISGVSGSTNGFDATATNNSSLFTFNTNTQVWVAAPNTNGLFSAGSGVRIMVRGNRSADLNNNNAAASETTLRATGALVTGPVTFTASGGAGIPLLSNVAGAFGFIGNPYASSVDWLKVFSNSRDISPTFYVYDPTISGSNGRGAYVSYNATMKVKSILSSVVSNDIQSGQAFFVQTATGTNLNPSITFNEADKSNVFLPAFRTASVNPALNIELLLPGQPATAAPADGTAVYFSDDYNNAIGAEDSYKLTNQDENLAILSSGKFLSLEGRKPVAGADSLQLYMWQLTKSGYTLKVLLENFDGNVEVYMEDKYLHKITPLRSGETLIPFTITSDAASKDPNRFRVIFETFATLPVKLTDIKAYLKNSGIKVEWVAESESNTGVYEVERSTDAQTFKTVGSAKAQNNPGIASAYSFLDVNPVTGDNYYRIKSVEKSGEVKLSEVVKVNVANGKTGISVVNNPVSGNTIQILLKNVVKGNYKLALITASGEKIYEGAVSYGGGTSLNEIKLKSRLAAGVYRLQVISDTAINSIYSVSVLMQ